MLAESPRPKVKPVTVEQAPAPTAPASAKTVVRPRRRYLWGLLLLLLLAGVGAAGYWQLRSKPAVTYRTATARVGNVVQSITASGTVNPEVTVQVGTYVSGVITELHCDYNTKVTKGQLCAKIDPRPYESTVAQSTANLSYAKAQLGKDQANLAYTKLTYERDVGLLKRGIVSQDTLDSARNAYDQAQAQIKLDQATIEQRTAELKSAQINLAYTDIISAVDGTVVSRNVTVGQTVAASFQTPTLFLIATDLTKMQVDANVSESDIGRVQEGGRATFTVEAFASHPFEGRVKQVRQAPISVQNVVTYDVVIGVDNPELLLKPGMTATTRIVVAERNNVLRVPEQALRFSPTGIANAGAFNDAAAGAPVKGDVWVLREGAPVKVPVSIGLVDGSWAEVVGGDLKAGDKVVVGEADAGAGNRAAQTTQPRLRF